MSRAQALAPADASRKHPGLFHPPSSTAPLAYARGCAGERACVPASHAQAPQTPSHATVRASANVVLDRDADSTVNGGECRWARRWENRGWATSCRLWGRVEVIWQS
jgi:hypothetical protein